MIADLKPYPSMKESGVPWLGPVPEHWNVSKLRHLLENATGRKRPDLTLLSVVREKGVIRRDVTGDDENRNFIPDDLSNYRVVRPGQFAMNKMKAWQGSYGVSPYEGLVSPAYFVFNLSGVDGTFFHAAIRSRTYVSFFAQASDGVRIGQWDLSQTRMREIGFVVPPLAEQAAIIRFLDHADRRIRRHIRAKQKLLKLLDEQKHAIIHYAVTRGLDPNVRLKPSGVEWLGYVPEHWEVKRLHQVTDPDRPVMYGIVLPGPNVDDGVYIVKGGNCEPGRLRPEVLSRTTFQIESRYTRSRLVAGDIVFAIRGGVGAAEMVPPELAGANLTQDAARIAAGERVHPEWLLHAVRAPIFREHVRSKVVGATVRGINIRDLKRIEVVVPPLDEQAQIVEYLQSGTRDIALAADRAHREIALLREYRTRLIADVVTGKLDIREAAAQLPDEAEELEPLAEADALSDADEGTADDLDAATEEAGV
jgi:type I restriction enzyme S subunit